MKKKKAEIRYNRILPDEIKTISKKLKTLINITLEVIKNIQYILRRKRFPLFFQRIGW